MGNKTKRKRSGNTEESSDSEDDSEIIQALALRNYHLPGYSCCADFMQWFVNGHPVLGIFCRHSLHPVGVGERIILLIGSTAFGLALTSAAYVWFYIEEMDENSTAFSFVDLSGNTVLISKGMCVLWTVGCILHSSFDYMMWHVSACAFCRTGGCCSACGCFTWIGSLFSLFIISTVVLLAIFETVVRMDMEAIEGLSDGERAFSFPSVCSIEIALALFCYSPIVGLFLFSGGFGLCTHVSWLGGRQRELSLASDASEIERIVKRETNGRTEPKEYSASPPWLS